MIPASEPRTSRGLLAALLLCVAAAAPGTHAADFNGDGIDDLLFRDRSRGDHRLALVLSLPGRPADGERRSLMLDSGTLRQRGFDVRIADFDGDGRSDVLDRDLESGRIRIRLMDGTTVRAAGVLQEPARQAAIEAVADFTGDGRADLLVRGGTSGKWSVFALWGSAVDTANSGDLALPWDAALVLAGVGDFDGDGRTDLLLRRTDTLRWRMVLQDGTRAPPLLRPAFLPLDPAWQLEATADLNGDHRDDLLFRHQDTGVWQAWHLDGVRALPSSGPVNLGTGLRWQLQRLEDLNGDNSPDAVHTRLDPAGWRVDYLQGSARLQESGPVAADTPPTLRVAGSGDYDGDGTRELLLAAADQWQLMDLHDPAVPRITALQIPPPRAWPLVCDPPRHLDFGQPARPADAGADTAFLSWSHPTTRENGEALCQHELAGFRILFQREGAGTVRSLQIDNPRIESQLIGPLRPGTWSFRILSVDSNGYSSQSSAGIAKTIP